MKLLEDLWNSLASIGSLIAIIGLIYQIYKDKKSIFKIDISVIIEYFQFRFMRLNFLVTLRNSGNRTIQLKRLGYRKSKKDKCIYEGFFINENEIIKPNEIKVYKLEIRSSDIQSGIVKYISAEDTEGRIYDFKISKLNAFNKKSN